MQKKLDKETKNAQRAEELKAQANKLYQAYDFAKAIALFKEATTLQPKAPVRLSQTYPWILS